MRASKISEILEILSLKPNGLLWSELVGRHKIIVCQNILDADHKKIEHTEIYLPRKTLDRHLKNLIKMGLVEKTVEKTGKKGRPSGRYNISPRWLPSMNISCKWIGKVFFPGKKISGYHGSKDYGSSVRLSGQVKKDYDAYRDWFKEHNPEEYEMLLKSEREKRAARARKTEGRY